MEALNTYLLVSGFIITIIILFFTILIDLVYVEHIYKKTNIFSKSKDYIDIVIFFLGHCNCTRINFC